MTYSSTSRIGSKFSDNPDLGQPNLVYGYDKHRLTHQPRIIHEFSSNQHLQLYWDANGNLRQIQPVEGYTRFHLWDDDNQLLLSVGPTTCGYYGNASNGQRAYKLTGTFSLSNINGGGVSGEAFFDNTVLYPNPYMTLTHDGYTKHYFMGSERIGTTIGGGNNGNWLVNPLDNLTQDEYNRMMVLNDSYLYQHYYYDCYDYPHSNSNTENTNHKGTVEYGDADYQDYQYWANEQYYGNIWLLFKCPLAEDLYVYYQKEEDDEPFYYHSDHLGSAAWITDKSGMPVQYVMYAPYGEELLNQHPWGYDERFKFTGKERDAETGYDYFGARYYLPIISIFGSVDPLANKFIYNSPYVYCEGNPIRYIDSNGKSAMATVAAVGASYWLTANMLEYYSMHHKLKEVGYAMKHPINAYCVGQVTDGSIKNLSSRSSNFAVNISNALFPNDEIQNKSYSNAIRHTVWQAILTRELGVEQATRIGNAHENSVPFMKQSTDTQADLLNNDIGRSIAEANPNADNATLAKLVIEEFHNNGLWIDINGSLQFTKLTDEQYRIAIDTCKQLNNNGKYE